MTDSMYYKFPVHGGQKIDTVQTPVSIYDQSGSLGTEVRSTHMDWMRQSNYS